MGVLKRMISVVIGIPVLLVMCCVGVVPFVVAFILFGIDRANVVMSTLMWFPMNWFVGDNIGDALLQWHKNFLEEEQERKALEKR